MAFGAGICGGGLRAARSAGGVACEIPCGGGSFIQDGARGLRPAVRRRRHRLAGRASALAGRARTFRPYDPTQQLLLAPSIDDWLPEDHPAGFRRRHLGAREDLFVEAVVDEKAQVILAVSVTQAASDVGQLSSMADRMVDNLAAGGIEGNLGVVLADAGYCSDDNLENRQFRTRPARRHGTGRRLKNQRPDPKGPTSRERVARRLGTPPKWANARMLALPEAGQVATFDEAAERASAVAGHNVEAGEVNGPVFGLADPLAARVHLGLGAREHLEAPVELGGFGQISSLASAA